MEKNRMNYTYAMMLVAVVSLVTMLLRFLPFLLFGFQKKTPGFSGYIGRVLPYAIMGMLVVYCLKGVSLTTGPFGLPELIAVAVVAGVHLWRRSTLLSIISGTVIYMVLIQWVFQV